MTIVSKPRSYKSKALVQTLTSNFTSYTMRRIQHQKHQMYKAKDFEIQSLTSLVKIAKEKTQERLDTDASEPSVKLPIHDVAERVVESLQHMHHHLQNFMMQKLGTDAQHIITAERARQASTANKIEAQMKKPGDADYVPSHLSEIGQEHGRDELELLNEYRLRYAGIMGELLVAKEQLLQLEVGLKDSAPDETLKRTISEDLHELNEINNLNERRWKRRSSEF